jgi:hypothetical protein
MPASSVAIASALRKNLSLGKTFWFTDISTYDFPETQTTLYQLAQQHNFVRFECLYKDTPESAQFLCLTFQ